MRLLHEIAIFQTVKSKVIISLFETVRLSVSISLRNLYNSLYSIKEKKMLTVCLFVSTEAVLDDTGAYKVEISNESGAASGAFKMKVVSKYCLNQTLLLAILSHLLLQVVILESVFQSICQSFSLFFNPLLCWPKHLDPFLSKFDNYKG